MALAAVSVVGLAGLAGADTGEATDGGRPARPQLTDAQKACLAEQGVTLPVRPADGTMPAPPSEEQRAAMKAAAEACGLPIPQGHGLRPQLTDAQKACLAEQGVTLPVRPADGTMPAPPSEEQRAAMKAAAQACGLPAPPGRPGGATAQATSLRVAV